MLKLIPPGKRKGNRTYIIRGRFAGRDVEKTTRTRDRGAAERLKHRIEQRLLSRRVPGPGEAVTFRHASEHYAAAKRISKREEKRLEKINAEIGDKLVSEILQAEVDSAAEALHPFDTAQTRNRNVYTPAAAVLHYASRSQWCAWVHFDRPEMPEPETRAAAPTVAAKLLDATTGKKRLLILWLFKHGTRITGALQVECSRIDLHRKTYELFITKNKTWGTFAIDHEVWELLANDPDVQSGEGRLFPAWRSRTSIYKWLVPLCTKLGIKFTPHMARHWLGKQLDAQGAGLKTIMKALGQKSEKSASRYAVSDVETVRVATGKIGELVGEKKARA